MSYNFSKQSNYSGSELIDPKTYLADVDRDISNLFLMSRNATSVIGDQNAFSTIAVSGQSSVIADSPMDTLNLAAGTNISLTTDAITDTVTINSAIIGTNTQVLFFDGANNPAGNMGLTYNKGTGTLHVLNTIEFPADASQLNGNIIALN